MDDTQWQRQHWPRHHPRQVLPTQTNACCSPDCIVHRHVADAEAEAASKAEERAKVWKTHSGSNSTSPNTSANTTPNTSVEILPKGIPVASASQEPKPPVTSQAEPPKADTGELQTLNAMLSETVSAVSCFLQELQYHPMHIYISLLSRQLCALLQPPRVPLALSPPQIQPSMGLMSVSTVCILHCLRALAYIMHKDVYLSTCSR